ncbi:MAG: hypothetical protein KBA46_03705 [Candidatus Omnitrophica bacterium]|nr:hypothetical protein [Candidatus Omnitrophota bacterium]
MLEKQNQPQKWYFKRVSLIVSFLCVGPCMLPLVWGNPSFSPKAKIVISVIVVVATLLLGVVFAKSLEVIFNYYKLLLAYN